MNYIVKHTIGVLLERRNLSQASRLRVLDPACGSGSFLIGAYQYLMDWHRDWYVKGGTDKFPKQVYQGPGGQWLLTTAERKRILLNSLFGVDIDPQAVEVTKLSLLLKMLEGESKQSLETQRRLFQERALPDLGQNILSGNSLIGPNIYNPLSVDELTEDELRRINAFEWHQAFPWLGQAGGFDAVIGNPPYIRIQRIEQIESEYLFRVYKGPTSKVDLSLVFLEKGLSLCTKIGRAAFICTSQWLSTKYGENLRGMLSDGRLHSIVHFGSLPVFRDASTYPAIFVLSPKSSKTLTVKRITCKAQLNLRDIELADPIKLSLDSLGTGPWNLGDLEIAEILESRHIRWEQLRKFGKAYIGTKCGLNAAFVIGKGPAKELRLERSLLYPYAYRGAEVDRYSHVDPAALIIYPYQEGPNGTPVLIPAGELESRFPNIYRHLLGFKTELRERKDSRKYYARGADWYRHLRVDHLHT